MSNLVLIDLGDACEETRQCSPDPPILPDSWFQWGARENRPEWPPQCP